MIMKYFLKYIYISLAIKVKRIRCFSNKIFLMVLHIKSQIEVNNYEPWRKIF